MVEAIGAVITAVLKVGVPIYVAVLIGTCLTLFLPDPVTQQIGIAAFRQSYRTYLGGALIAALSAYWRRRVCPVCPTLLAIDWTTEDYAASPWKHCACSQAMRSSF